MTTKLPQTPPGSKNPETPPTAKEWGALFVLSLGLGIIVLDGTIVGVAMPDIISDLSLNIADAQWVSSLYAVVLGALLFSSGALSDRWGRRLMFMLGVGVFVIGSVIAGLVSTGGLLIGARVVQAVGAAFIMPSTLSTVNTLFRGKYRAAAFGIWGAVISAAAAFGPLAGGALTQYASWRWIFWVNVPIGIILLVAALLTIPETKASQHLPGTDNLGVLLSAVGLGGLVFAVIEGPAVGWWTPTADLQALGLSWSKDSAISIVPVVLAISLAALTAFFFLERERGRANKVTVLDLSLFKLRTFSWGNTVAAMVAIGEFALLFVLPLYLINAVGLSVMSAGWILAGMALGAFFAGASARFIAGRYGSPGTVVFGLGLEVLGVAGLLFILSPTASGLLIVLPLAVYGFGLGLASAQLTGTVLRDVPVDQSGQGSATQSTVRQIGAALGTAFSGALLSIALSISIPRALAGIGITGREAGALAEATRASAGTNLLQMRFSGEAATVEGAKLLKALDAGFTSATQWSLVAAIVFLLVGLIGAVRLMKVAEETGE